MEDDELPHGLRPEFIHVFRQALEAYDSGDLARAHQLFVQAQDIEPDNVWALLWCGATAPTPQETINWLEQALAIEPGNTHAEAGLAWAREQAAAQAEKEAQSTAEEAVSLEEWADDGGAPTTPEVHEEAAEGELALDVGEETSEEWLLEESPADETEQAAAATAEETWDVDMDLLGIDEEDIPDWLRGEEEAPADAGEATAVADTDWLLQEEAHAEAEAPPAEAEELPDWLAGEAETPAQPQEEVTLPTAPPEGSLPPPNEVVAAYQAGLAAWEENRLDEAARYFEQTVRLDPNHVQAYDYLGSVYFLLGQSDKAIQAYKRALSIDPNYAESYFNLGLVYQETGDRENAIAMFERYLKLDPDSTFAENARMFLQQLKGGS
ncbi:MAG: tetratricopeptide repeat protein [Ardenticatenia bacterium]|nr:tetratricopeptide repeat protein [Ardenticatenia bacterium]